MVTARARGCGLWRPWIAHGVPLQVALHAGVNDVLPYKKVGAKDPPEVPNTCAGSSTSLAQLVHHGASPRALAPPH